MSDWQPAIIHLVHEESPSRSFFNGKKVRVRAAHEWEIVRDTWLKVGCNADRFCVVHPEDVDNMATEVMGHNIGFCEHEFSTD